MQLAGNTVGVIICHTLRMERGRRKERPMCYLLSLVPVLLLFLIEFVCHFNQYVEGCVWQLYALSTPLSVLWTAYTGTLGWGGGEWSTGTAWCVHRPKFKRQHKDKLTGHCSSCQLCSTTLWPPVKAQVILVPSVPIRMYMYTYMYIPARYSRGQKKS